MTVDLFTGITKGDEEAAAHYKGQSSANAHKVEDRRTQHEEYYHIGHRRHYLTKLKMRNPFTRKIHQSQTCP